MRSYETVKKQSGLKWRTFKETFRYNPLLKTLIHVTK